MSRLQFDSIGWVTGGDMAEKCEKREFLLRIFVLDCRTGFFEDPDRNADE